MGGVAYHHKRTLCVAPRLLAVRALVGGECCGPREQERGDRSDPLTADRRSSETTAQTAGLVTVDGVLVACVGRGRPQFSADGTFSRFRSGLLARSPWAGAGRS